MKRFTKTLMVALMAVCLSVCFLFAGCSKHAGTYVGVSAIGNTSIELKLKAGDEFEMTIGDTTKTGTWAVSEEDENVVVLTISGVEYKATVTEDIIKMPLILDGALGGASLASLTKK